VSMRSCAAPDDSRSAIATSSRRHSSIQRVRSSSEPIASTMPSFRSGSGDAATSTTSACTDAHHAATFWCSCRYVTASTSDSAATSIPASMFITNRSGGMSVSSASNSGIDSATSATSASHARSRSESTSTARAGASDDVNMTPD
jgi:hypothetical protein